MLILSIFFLLILLLPLRINIILHRNNKKRRNTIKINGITIKQSKDTKDAKDKKLSSNSFSKNIPLKHMKALIHPSFKRLYFERIIFKLGVGYEDAAVTAMICGFLWTIDSFLKVIFQEKLKKANNYYYKFQVTPLYNSNILNYKIEMEFYIIIGHLLYLMGRTAVLLLKITGGEYLARKQFYSRYDENSNGKSRGNG